MSNTTLHSELLSELQKTNCTTWDYLLSLEDVQVEPKNYRQQIVSAAFGFICIVGLLANAFLLISLLLGEKRGVTFRAPSTILIINLAVADTLLLLTLPFAIVHRLHESWPFGTFVCKLEESIKFLSYYASVFFITAMAVDRFSIVCHPVTYNRKRARKNLWIASASLWFISLVLVVPIMVFAQIDFHGYCNIEFPVDKNSSSLASLTFEDYESMPCLENLFEYFELDEYYDLDSLEETALQESLYQESLYSYDAYFSKCFQPPVQSLHIWLVCNFIIGFVIPFVIISVSYFKIVMLKASVVSTNYEVGQPSLDKTVGDDLAPSEDERNARRESNKIVRKQMKAISSRARVIMGVLIPLLVFAFAICWLPYHTWHLAQIKGVNVDDMETCSLVQDITFCLAFFNSAINPILNSFFLFNFKERLQHSASWFKRLSARGNLSVNSTDEGLNAQGGNEQKNGDAVFATTTLDNTDLLDQSEVLDP
ncbi:somatostatin receptor type 2-like [Clavelina lepadiformis]|uniref:somatostatin receptor type 2-like n=1 Tax=Clavelina lepadiformis TaxID=159417 RepID=UPI004041B1C4